MKSAARRSLEYTIEYTLCLLDKDKTKWRFEFKELAVIIEDGATVGTRLDQQTTPIENARFPNNTRFENNFKMCANLEKSHLKVKRLRGLKSKTWGN